MGNSALRLIAQRGLKSTGALTSGLLISVVTILSLGFPGAGDTADVPAAAISESAPGSSQIQQTAPATDDDSEKTLLSGPDLVLPVYNKPGLDALIGDLGPNVRSSDTVLVVTGNNDRSLDLDWLQYATAEIQTEFPGVTVYAMTAGFENVSRIRDARIDGVSGVVYDYENHFPNAPEFDYDFEATISSISQFHSSLENSNLASVALPTGLPLAKHWAQKWEWDYAKINAEVDSLVIQTQSYCLASSDDFEEAVVKGNAQHAAMGLSPTSWIPQVTVDPNSTNGVTPAKAAECAGYATGTGHDTIMVWWSPRFSDEAIAFMELVRS